VSLEDILEKETEDLSTQPYHHVSDFENDCTEIIIQDIIKDILKDFSWASLKRSMEKVNFFKIMLVHFRTYLPIFSSTLPSDILDSTFGNQWALSSSFTEYFNILIQSGACQASPILAVKFYNK